MRNAITAFFISKGANLNLKSLKLRAYSLKLRAVILCRTLLNKQRQINYK